MVCHLVMVAACAAAARRRVYFIERRTVGWER